MDTDPGDSICASAVSQNTMVVFNGKLKDSTDWINTLLVFPHCSNSFDVTGITTEVFSELKILHALKH